MSFLLFHRLAPARRACTKTIIVRYLNQQRARDGGAHSPQTDQGSFEGVGIQPGVAASLHIAFPNVRRPTAMQRKLIRAITSNRDVLLQDDTGTGKSFAAMLALLSKLRVKTASSVGGEGKYGGLLTALLIVPHRDLAYQYLHWIHHMTLPDGDTPTSLTKYAQVLLRHVNKAALQGLPNRMQEAVKSASCDQDLLIHKQPHVLIGTPNALLEFIEGHPEVLPTLSTVVVDEVDALLRIPDSKAPKRRGGPQDKLGKHVPDLVRVLDKLFPPPKDMHGMHLRSRSVKEESLEQSHAAPTYRPQLVMISATLRNKFRNALFNTFGWVQREKVLKLLRKRSSALPAHRLGRSAIHHVLAVSKTGEIKNIAGAQPLQADVTNNGNLLDNGDGEDDVVCCGDDDDAELVGDVDEALLHAPLAIDPAMLDAVAATFALDVRRVGLLVLPATAAVRKIIFELQQMGVNAHPLDLAGDEASRTHVLSRLDEVSDENPVLIVATLATVRGIDLPDLSHVFMLGVPEGRSGDAYLHVAGRVGRFGRQGRVITVVEEARTRKMTMLLSRIGVQPTRLAHFE